MIRKIVTMCAAALFACAGAVADDGSDPGVLTPGGWTTDLTVNGKKVWSKYCQPKGAGWSCKYDSKEKCFKLNLSSVTEYTLGGEFSGRVMDKNGNVTKIEVGMVTISQQSTVTLDNLVMRGNISVAAGKTVTLYLKGKNEIIPAVGFYYSGTLSVPLNSTVWIDGDKTGTLNVHDCGGLVSNSGGSLVKPGTTKGGCVKVIGGQLVDFGCSLIELTVMGGKVEGVAVAASIHADEFNVTASGYFAGGCVEAKTADLRGDVTVTELSVDSLEVPYGTTLTVEEDLQIKDVRVTGGNIVLNGTNSSGIKVKKDGSVTISGGSISGRGGIYGTYTFDHIIGSHGAVLSVFESVPFELRITGGVVDVEEIGYETVLSAGNWPGKLGIDEQILVGYDATRLLMSGGSLKVNRMLVDSYEQRGGCVRATDVYLGRKCLIADGSFLSSALAFYDFRDRPLEFDCGGLQATLSGGSFRSWTYRNVNFKFPYSSNGCTLVDVRGLPANTRVEISDLGFAYGTKDIWTDSNGKIYLWFPNREQPYRFTVNGSVYEATVHGMDTTATLVEAKRYSVTYRTNQGQLYDGVNNCWSQEYLFENLYVYGETPSVYGAEDLQLTCAGKRFDHWENVTDGRKTVMPGEKLPPLTGDVTLVAYWVEITADDVSKESEEGAAPVDPVKAGEKIVTVRFYMDPWESNPRDYVEQDYIAGERYGNLPVVTPPEGRVLDFWQRRTGGGFGGEKIDEDSIVRAENHCLYANWKLRPATEWTCQFVTKTGLSDDSDWSVFAKHDFNIASPVAWMPSETPTRPRHRFVRWETYNDRECIMEPVTIDTIVAQRPSWVEAVWERDWFDWTRNRFESKVLSTITDDFPSDPAQVKSVKGQGLAAGLKLVQEKATKQWCLEGVPTELIDHATRDMYVEVTLKDGTKSTLLVKVRVNPEVPVVMRPAFVNENYGMCEYMHRLDENGRQLGSVAEVTPAEMRHPFVMADEYWPGAAKDWKITGLPAGLKFATKDATAWTDAVGIKQFAPLGSIYGFVKAPCAAIVTASHTVKGVAGGSYTESFKSTIEIHTYETTSDGYWIGGFLTDARIDGYVGEKTVYTFSSEHGLANNSKFKFTGLPSGLSYTAVEKKVSGYEKPIPAGSIYGTLKKETKAWASGTDGSGDRPLTVIVSFTERPPEVSVNAGAGGLLKAALMKFKPTEAAAIAEAGTALMQGAAYKYRISCDADAKVKVAGQPTGLKVVQNKDKKSADYGKWTLEGVPTKPGEYIAVITVTLNGVSSSITQRYVVRENAFAGEYRGVIASSPAADAAPRAGTILVNIAAGGATKVTVSEDGKSTLTYSAKSFGYSDSGDYAFVEFELKPSSADKKAGYGVRKGRVTISKPDAEVTDYRIFEGTVKLEDGTAVGEVEGWFVAPSAADDYRTSISRECRFFSVNDGSFDAPIATVRLQIKAGAKGKAATADVAGTLYDGTAFKLAKVPLIRDVVKPAAGEEANACYSFAPFAAKAKDGQVFVFHGFKRPVSWNELGAEGRVTFVNAAGEVVTVEEESGEGRSAAAIDFNSFFSHRYASSQMIFDYGRDGFETFALDHASGAAKGDCVVLGADGGEVTRIPAKSKIGLLGDFTYKFTTKDKVYTYEINLVTAPLERYLADGTIDWMESGRLVGLVTKTWKDGKATKSLSGIVDVVGLEPAE